MATVTISAFTNVSERLQDIVLGLNKSEQLSMRKALRLSLCIRCISLLLQLWAQMLGLRSYMKFLNTYQKVELRDALI